MSGHPRAPAAFLDRDGVINEDRGYVSLWSDFVFLPDVVEALRRLQGAGYLLVIVTNQSGIGRGYYTGDAFARLTAHMRGALAAEGVAIDGVYHCPHAANAGCSCRKPFPGLIEQAVRDLSVDRARSFLVGDKRSDILAGRAAGLAATYQVGDGPAAPEATARFADLAACVDAVLAPPSVS